MSYSDGDRRIYAFGPTTYTSDVAESIRGPKGKKGRLLWLSSHATTTFAGATTRPKLQVGVTGTLTAYANWDMGTLAAGKCIQSDDSLQTSNPITQAEIPADTDLVVGLIAATGGGAAGVGRTEVCIEWSW